MKNFLCIAVLLTAGSGVAFSLEEAWLSTGFEFGNSIEHTDDGSTYIGAPGFNINGYSFGDKKDIGFFFHYAFLFPSVVSGSGEAKDYDLQWEFIIGPGFRYSLSDDLKLQFGVGLDWMPIIAAYTENSETGASVDYSKVAYNLGAGADIGIKYDIKDYFYINAGLTLSYMFYNYTSLTSVVELPNDISRRTQLFHDNVKPYSMFGIKPYICIGFNYYQEKLVWGKPKS
jgi:hypothetical protein